MDAVGKRDKVPSGPEADGAEETPVRRPRGARPAEGRQRSRPADGDFPDLLTHDAAARLLAWYDREARVLPWRYRPGEKADPYRVWLSEIMLQQTTVKAVIPYFQKFTKRWPTVTRLAKADPDEVLAAWAGLGYYSRARNLHKCAQEIARDHKGRFPRTESDLKELPGVGPYTAAAIAAIAFGEKATVVDGNVERVVARLFAVDTPMPAAKPELRKYAATLTPDQRAGDFAQAMMDLGATVCSPKRPSCLMCPLARGCKAHADGIEETLPRRAAKAERPVRRTAAYVVLRDDGYVLLRKRPPAGLLGGMAEVPSTPWDSEAPSQKAITANAPVQAKWMRVPGGVVHIFTHFRLEVDVYCAIVPRDVALSLWAEPERCTFVARRDLQAQALPSLMRKIIAHALAQG